LTLLLKSVRGRRDRSVVRPGAPTCVHFHSALGFFTPVHSRQASTPWSVLQDGSPAPIKPASLPLTGRGPRPPRVQSDRGCNTAPRGGHVPRASVPPPEPALARARRSAPAGDRRVIRRARVLVRKALPLQQFHVLFNPLSKVLFSFRSPYLCAIGLWQ